jgi:hypothetical protein
LSRVADRVAVLVRLVLGEEDGELYLAGAGAASMLEDLAGVRLTVKRVEGAELCT